MIKRITLILDENIWKMVKIKAINTNLSLTNYLKNLIKQDLSKEKDTPHLDK